MKQAVVSDPEAMPAAITQQPEIQHTEVLLNPVVSNLYVQTKLSVGSPNDPLEHEADAVTDQVMRMSESSFIQRKCAHCQEEELQRKPKVTFIQKKNDLGGTAISGDTGKQIESTRGSGNKMDSGTQDFMESRFGSTFSDIKIHTDPVSNQLSKSLNAQAFTIGKDIYFNEGKYNPASADGKRLLSHELTHTIQQNNIAPKVQREPDTVNMPPLTVTSGFPDTSSLSTPLAPGEMSAGRDTATIEANSQLPETTLPFTETGWNGTEIANKLGQYDRIPGTDSDAVRCVQAVALMSHILNGPDAAINYLVSISFQGFLQSGVPGQREKSAMKVIDFVKAKIKAKQATYGHMYWAMEAVHDLFYSDRRGTPAATPDTVRSQIVPSFDSAQSMVNMDVWCNNKDELLKQANALNPGEQLMLNTWGVSFNSTFDLADIPSNRKSTRLNITDEEGKHSRSVFIRRIDASKKPTASQIDLNRDHKGGHQMLIYKDLTDSHIKMYEPEITTSGDHLFDLTADPGKIDTEIFADQPAFELYHYLQIWGKIIPAPVGSSFGK
ncbi:hypothetical protein ADIARSV_2339 [Arcticibacter svalbardensis MN12-7]|uniref:eCIS core domain-containing protein n=1 Tax=Arcticibacter svalbardensis MN12-7 TaxID=1150600 RepID=R9GS16_9SPHI|nr:DUF4157 domain-containing protein [Arcticibacter svalbardensis]EOR94493.1 hypothetical protein ADIARSV_2339 [Arcticibacter svalbardensis MN12-7]